LRELRIHHFYDIIRDYGSGKIVEKHEYGHSYHIIAKEIFENRLLKIKLIIKHDDVCKHCSKLLGTKCVDSIQHRSDFTSKEKFNDYLDSRIMKCMGYKIDQMISVKEILRESHRYLDAIDELYVGNDIDHTKLRKQHVSMGIKKKRNELGL